MTTNHIATPGGHMAYFVNAAGRAAPTGREQRMTDLMTRWREQMSKRKGLLSTVSILPLAACGGSDPKTLVINNPTDDISLRTDLAGFRLDLHNTDTTLTMTVDQHNSTSFINTGGDQTVVFSDAGTTSTKAGIESYTIFEGSTLTISPGTDGVNVTETGTPEDDSRLLVGGRTLTGTFTGFDATDILEVTSDANISGANSGAALGLGVLDFADTDNVTVTMTIAQHDAMNMTNTANAQTIKLSDDGTVATKSGIETYDILEGTRLTISSGTDGVNVTESDDGDDSVDAISTLVVGGRTLTGTFTAFDATDVLEVTSSADISGANSGGVLGLGVVDFDDTNNVTLTMSVAQHEAMTVARTGGTQTITLSDAGTLATKSGIENYEIVEGSTLTVGGGASGVNVKETGTVGTVSTVDVSGLTLTGDFVDFDADDVLKVTESANLAGAQGDGAGAGSALGFGVLDLDDSPLTLTLTQAQHQGLATVNNTDGVQTFVITTTGGITARDGIENYTLSATGNQINVNSNETGVNITGGAGADTVVVGGLTVTGTYTGLAAADTISATAGADFSGVNGGAATGAGILNVNNSAGTFTMSAAQHEGLTTVNNTTNAQTFVLTSAGTITARDGIETYELADAGGSTFTQSATTTPVTVKSGAGNDLIITDDLDANRGAMTIDLSAGGNDTVRILNDTGSLVSGSTATPTENGKVDTTYGGFGGHVGYNSGSFTDTTNTWNTASQPGSSTYVEIVGFTAFATNPGRDIVQLEGYTGAVIEGVNRTTTDLRGVASGSILEINTAGSGFTIALDQAGNLSTVANMLRTLSNVEDGEYYVIVYDGSDINANAFLYYARATEGDGFDFADTNGAASGYDTDSVELIAVFHEVGANAFSSLNFEAVPPVV